MVSTSSPRRATRKRLPAIALALGLVVAFALGAAAPADAATVRTATVKISGTAKVGQTLHAKTSSWTKGAKLSYQWLRSAKAIKGATHSTYKIVAADAGKKLSVKVKGTKKGYKAAAKTSKTVTVAKKPSAAANWYTSAFGTFAPLSYSGSNSDLIELPAGVTAGYVTIDFHQTGDDDFNLIVTAQDSKFDDTDLIINEIGDYTGGGVFGLDDKHAREIAVEATEGDWTMKIVPIASLPGLPSHGTGSGAYRYDGGSGIITVTNSNAEDNFIVEQYSKSRPFGDLLVNQIGDYSGHTHINTGPSVVTVEDSADAFSATMPSWTITH